MAPIDTTSSPGPSSELQALELFKTAVWGDHDIFKAQHTPESHPRTVEYLDFGQHLEAVQLFCEAVKVPQLMVVDEYRKAMNVFKRRDGDYARGACILGQPGIEKSCFIAYAVVELLREKQPVAVQVPWYSPDGFLVFSEDSVAIHDAKDRNALVHTPPIWAFSDSNHLSPRPTRAFSPNIARVFQTTSPKESRYKEWTKHGEITRYFMDLWSPEEIEDFAYLFYPTKVRLIKAWAEKFGCICRTLKLHASQPSYEDEYLGVVMAAIDSVVNSPKAAVRSLANFDNSIDPGSSKVFLIRPDKENARYSHTVSVSSNWILDQLVKKLNNSRAVKQLEFFDIMSVHQKTRPAAGCIFEDIIHRFLVSGRMLTVQWCDDETSQELELPPLTVCSTYSDLHSSTPFYWRPTSGNNPGIDGAIITNDHVYVFQATISDDPTSPQVGVDALWDQMPEDKKILLWKCLFIGSDEGKVKRVTWKYAYSLQVGAVQTRKAVEQGAIERHHLPVGRLVIHPSQLDE